VRRRCVAGTGPIGAGLPWVGSSDPPQTPQGVVVEGCPEGAGGVSVS